MIFPVQLPNPIPKFKLQVWDANIVTANEAICEANLNFRSWYKKVYRHKKERDALKRQWVSLKHPAFEGVQGEIEVTFELLTANEAAKDPAGLGRKGPNALPAPVRPDTSFNPFRIDKWFSVMFWGKYKWKILGCVICVVLVVVIALILYLLSFFRII